MEAKPFGIQSHMHACMHSHAHSLTQLESKYIVKYKHKINTINFPNTIANTLVRTVFKYKYKYFP